MSTLPSISYRLFYERLACEDQIDDHRLHPQRLQIRPVFTSDIEIREGKGRFDIYPDTSKGAFSKEQLDLVKTKFGRSAYIVVPEQKKLKGFKKISLDKIKDDDPFLNHCKARVLNDSINGVAIKNIWLYERKFDPDLPIDFVRLVCEEDQNNQIEFFGKTWKEIYDSIKLKNSPAVILITTTALTEDNPYFHKVEDQWFLRDEIDDSALNRVQSSDSSSSEEESDVEAGHSSASPVQSSSSSAQIPSIPSADLKPVQPSDSSSSEEEADVEAGHSSASPTQASSSSSAQVRSIPSADLNRVQPSDSSSSEEEADVEAGHPSVSPVPSSSSSAQVPSIPSADLNPEKKRSLLLRRGPLAWLLKLVNFLREKLSH